MLRLQLLKDFETVIEVLRTRVQLETNERDDETLVRMRAHLEGIRGCGLLLLVLGLLSPLVLVGRVERRDLGWLRRGGDRGGHGCGVQAGRKRGLWEAKSVW